MIPLLLCVAILAVSNARLSSTFPHFSRDGNHVHVSSNQRARDCGHSEPGIGHIRTMHVEIQSDTIVTMILNASYHSKIVVVRDHDPGDTCSSYHPFMNMYHRLL